MSINERSITVGILGANHEITQKIGDALGSPGQRSDLQFYNRLDTKVGVVFTGVVPIGYPEKIKCLIQACAETRVHMMVIDAETGITPEIGEILVIMDIFTRRYGTQFLAVIGGVTSQNEWQIPEIKKTLPKLLASTALKDIEIIPLKIREDYEHLKERINKISLEREEPVLTEDTPAKMLIDHAFPVKGVGSVVLGLVQEGQFIAGKMYDMIPVQKKVILRSIQKFDRDFKTAEAGDRVGLALKGIKIDKVDRNAIFCTLDSLTTSQKLDLNLYVSKFYKPQGELGKISPNDTKTYHVLVDLGVSNIRIESGEDISPGQVGKLHVTLEKELVHDPSGMRGIMVDFGPFEKRSRIVGYFEQIL